MEPGKAVEEVWTWRESLEKDLAKIPESEQVEYLNKKARETCAELGINCRFVKRVVLHQNQNASKML
jgi:hypothetical protein